MTALAELKAELLKFQSALSEKETERKGLRQRLNQILNSPELNSPQERARALLEGGSDDGSAIREKLDQLDPVIRVLQAAVAEQKKHIKSQNDYHGFEYYKQCKPIVKARKLQGEINALIDQIIRLEKEADDELQQNGFPAVSAKVTSITYETFTKIKEKQNTWNTSLFSAVYGY